MGLLHWAERHLRDPLLIPPPGLMEETNTLWHHHCCVLPEQVCVCWPLHISWAVVRADGFIWLELVSFFCLCCKTVNKCLIWNQRVDSLFWQFDPLIICFTVDTNRCTLLWNQHKHRVLYWFCDKHSCEPSLIDINDDHIETGSSSPTKPKSRTDYPLGSVQRRSYRNQWKLMILSRLLKEQQFINQMVSGSSRGHM